MHLHKSDKARHFTQWILWVSAAIMGTVQVADVYKRQPKYDINNHTHLEIMSAEFDMYSHDDWDEYVALAEKRNMHYKSINVLRSAGKKAGLSKYLSPKVINWVLELVDELDEAPKDEQ